MPVKHHACPECTSSDGAITNSDGSVHCYACDGHFWPDNTEAYVAEVKVLVPKPEGEAADIPDRKLTRQTLQTYGTTVVKNGSGVIKHCYNYFDDGGTYVGAKVREVADKRFTVRGKMPALFGQSSFKGGGKYVTITEGELDALAVHQMTGNKWPAVSLRNGASGAVKDIKENLEWLESFDNVVLCFDNDGPGRKAAAEAAKLFTPKKCSVMQLPLKDACDMLMANRAQEFISAFWNAEQYVPSGIKNVSKMEADYFNRPDTKGLPYPWEGLNAMTYGARKRELVTFTGGTGIGKTSITRELEHHFITQTEDNVGVIKLEEDWRRTVDGIISIEANARLHIHEIREAYPEDKFKQHFAKLFHGNNEDRVFIHSHLGIQDFDDIMAKLRFLIVGCDCDWIILDHLQMLVSMYNGPDERQIIDEVMLRLRSIVEETGVGMFLVSHLRRTQSDKGHEQGLEVSLSHLRGSQSISQISDIVIAAERNQQASDGTANRTQLRVLKNRPIGSTGIACQLAYDTETGRMHEVDPDDEFEEEEF